MEKCVGIGEIACAAKAISLYKNKISVCSQNDLFCCDQLYLIASEL